MLHLLHLLHLLLLLQLLLALILGDHRELLREEDGPSVAEAVARELLVRAVELLGVLGAPRVVVRRVGRVKTHEAPAAAKTLSGGANFTICQKDFEKSFSNRFDLWASKAESV